jgi:hypothetical protein
MRWKDGCESGVTTQWDEISVDERELCARSEASASSFYRPRGGRYKHAT